MYNFLFSLTESENEKQLKKNVAIIMQNQYLQQPLIETNAQANNITHMHLARNRHMMN